MVVLGKFEVVWKSYLALLLFFISIEPFLGVLYPLFKLSSDFIFLIGILFSLIFVFISAIQNNKLKKSTLCLFLYSGVVISTGFMKTGDFQSVLTISFFEIKFLIFAMLFVFFKEVKFNAAKLVFFLFLINYSVSILQLFDVFGVKSSMIALVFSNAHDYYKENVLGGGVFGFLMSKNVYGYFALLTGIIIYFFKPFKSNRLNLLALLICISGVIFSQSRTALAFMLVIFWIESSFLKKSSITLLSFITIIAFLFIDISTLPKSVQEIFNPDYYMNVMDVGRGAYLFASLNEFVLSPLFGVGAGNWGLGLAYNPAYQHNEIIFSNGYQIPLGVFQDNNWLSILVQYGLLSFILFLLFWFFLYRDFSKGNKKLCLYLIGLIFFNSMFLAGFTIKILMIVSCYFIVNSDKVNYENIART